MTREEKTKAYDEAIERARRIKNGEDNWRYSDLTEIIPALEEVLPELTESEDERIKKIITDSVFYQYGAGVEYKDVLDYLDKLEKQKEQKPVESISQLTVQGKGVYKICPRCKERMVRDDSMVYTSMPPQYRYECPKCGESECDTFMYDNPEMEEQKPVVTHGETYHVDTLGTQQVIAGKMPQKSAEWSEEDEQRVKQLIYDTEAIRAGYEKRKESLGDDFNDELIKDCDEQIKWLKSLPKRFTLQPKQEWSEEDEKIAKEIEEELWYPGDFPDYPSKEESELYDDCQRRLNWFKNKLKSLRSQPKQEWSKDDERCWNLIWDILDGPFIASESGYKKARDWFIENCPKGYKHSQSSWKPSEEQMEALTYAIQLLDDGISVKAAIAGEELESLREDLKKL